MAQFLVLAYDGCDEGGRARRAAARASHFESVEQMVKNGEIRAGGAILDEAGTMVGSALFVEFPSRAELDAWLEKEPYMQQGVWQRIEVRPFRLAVLDGKITP